MDMPPLFLSFWVLTCSLLCSAASSTLTIAPLSASSSTTTLYEIALSTTSSAIPAPACNDGSPYKYYVHLSESGSSNWVLFLQGGGACFDQASCSARSSSSMSSNSWPSTRTFNNGILCGNPTCNPFFYDWNQVFVSYCTSDNFAGNATAGSTGLPWSFLGSRVIIGILHDLEARGVLFNEAATTVLLTGSSAGGMGVLANLDRAKQYLSRATVLGVVDSGWFMDSVPFKEQACIDTMSCTEQEAIQKGVLVWNPEPDQDCMQAYSGNDLWRCFFGEYVAPFVATQTFVFEFLYDWAQLSHDGITDGINTPDELAYAQTSASNLTNSLKNTAAAVKSFQHFYVPACYYHGILNNNPEYATLKVDGILLVDALRSFVESAVTDFFYVDTCGNPDCNPTCPTLDTNTKSN